ncbi:MAG TPA: hypothetical protein VFD62_09280 [Pyrinomonadaceae bacterium]|nr:hypothetical protein [Pyrinomonadaceae bacterium]
MINNPFHQDDAVEQQHYTNRRLLLGIVCAVAVTALLVAGYAFVRRYHGQRILAENPPPPPVTDSGPKGPPIAHVVIDEPTLEKGFTVIGGAVKNISDRDLSDLFVVIEMRRRKDGGIEDIALPVSPPILQPQQEGAFSLKAAAQDFASIRLAGVKAEPQSTLVAYTSSQGKKRPPERFEPKIVVVKRSGKPGEFINTPDNPGRIR